jgi:hypothetical protein
MGIGVLHDPVLSRPSWSEPVLWEGLNIAGGVLACHQAAVQIAGDGSSQSPLRVESTLCL